jgi:hypothetical protein
VQLFIPAKNKKQAERAAPFWACRFARVRGGFIAFDSEETLRTWKESARREKPVARAFVPLATHGRTPPRRTGGSAVSLHFLKSHKK